MTATPAQFRIVIHENILQENLLPAELLGEHRFELRSFKDPSELPPLMKSLVPQAMILDLRNQESVIEDTMHLIQETRNLISQPPVPILGIQLQTILQNWDKYQFEKYFELGVTQIFQIPLAEDKLINELQTYLGLQFRKHERKWVDQEVVLIAGKKTYKANLKIINRECLAVDGQELPPVGSNVRVKSLSPFPIALDHRCFVLKILKPAGTLLRFIDPTADFLQRIDALPQKSEALERQISPSPPTAKPPEVTANVPEFLINPYRFLPLDIDAGQDIFAAWFLQKTPAPKIWAPLIQSTSEKSRQDYQNFCERFPMVGRAFYCNTLLAAQLAGLQKLSAEDIKKIAPAETLADHEEKVKILGGLLQMEITALLQAKNNPGFLFVNELKTALQKNLAAMKATLGTKTQVTLENETKPAPAKTPSPKPKANSANPVPKTTAHSTSVKSAIFAVFLLTVAGFSSFWAYQKIMAPRQAVSLLSESDAKTLSPYVQQISQMKIGSSLQWTVVMTASWNQLSDGEMDQERVKILERLKVHGVSQAQFVVVEPGRNFSFSEGQFRVQKQRPKSQKN